MEAKEWRNAEAKFMNMLDELMTMSEDVDCHFSIQQGVERLLAKHKLSPADEELVRTPSVYCYVHPNLFHRG
eukprot:306055-Pyramimonas_sp.AAC.1